MGWTRIATLQRDADFPSGEDSIWTRGGFEGVRVRVADQTVTIPRHVLEALAGEEMRASLIREIENSADGDLWRQRGMR